VDLPAERRLRDVQTLRCTTKAQFLGDRNEILEMSQTDWRSHTQKVSQNLVLDARPYKAIASPASVEINQSKARMT
jgi:hypothetical protein